MHWNHFKDASNYSNSYVSSKDASDASWIEGLGDNNGGHANDLWIEADPFLPCNSKEEFSMILVMLYRS